VEKTRNSTSGHEERLRGVKVDAPDGPVVLVKAVEEGAHAVVPHLDDSAMEAGQDPWAARVEGEALDPVALGLELGEHLPPPVRGERSPLARGSGGPAGRESGGSEGGRGRTRKGSEWGRLEWISPALSQMRIEIPEKETAGAASARGTRPTSLVSPLRSE
jgi:hypothetical protein